MRPKVTRLAVDEGDGASRVPFGGCWAAFHEEESPRARNPDPGFRSSETRHPDLIPPPALEAGWLVLGCRPPPKRGLPSVGAGSEGGATAVTAIARMCWRSGCLMWQSRRRPVSGLL